MLEYFRDILFLLCWYTVPGRAATLVYSHSFINIRQSRSIEYPVHRKRSMDGPTFPEFDSKHVHNGHPPLSLLRLFALGLIYDRVISSATFVGAASNQKWLIHRSGMPWDSVYFAMASSVLGESPRASSRV